MEQNVTKKSRIKLGAPESGSDDLNDWELYIGSETLREYIEKTVKNVLLEDRLEYLFRSTPIMNANLACSTPDVGNIFADESYVSYPSVEVIRLISELIRDIPTLSV